MSANTAEGLESSPDDRAEHIITNTVESFVESVTDALESADADPSLVDVVEDEGDQMASTVGRHVDELTNTVRDQQETIDELQDDLKDRPTVDVEDEGDPLGSLTVDGAPVGRAITSKPSRTDVEDMIEDVTPTPDDAETTIQEHDATPIERLAVADDVEEVTDSVSVERAVSLFQNLSKWGAKTPKGICLRPADNPLQLLEADRDESLAWKQYYRAAKVLERLSKGAVTFFDSDRHGKMIVLHEQSDVYERVVNGGLTASSEEAAV